MKIMEKFIANINWKKVIAVASCVVSGVMAFGEAMSEQKSAAKLADLEARLKNLESK